MPSLLNIEEYYVNKIEVTTNPDYKQSDIKACNLDVDFDLKQSNDNPLIFMIQLFVELDNTTDPCSAEYHVKLDITGYFSFVEGTPEETVKNMIAPSGLALLYGAARGVVAQVTANCKHGKYILPTLNFMEIIRDKAKKFTEEKAVTLDKGKAA